MSRQIEETPSILRTRQIQCWRRHPVRRGEWGQRLTKPTSNRACALLTWVFRWSAFWGCWSHSVWLLERSRATDGRLRAFHSPWCLWGSSPFQGWPKGIGCVPWVNRRARPISQDHIRLKTPSYSGGCTEKWKGTDPLRSPAWCWMEIRSRSQQSRWNRSRISCKPLPRPTSFSDSELACNSLHLVFICTSPHKSDAAARELSNGHNLRGKASTQIEWLPPEACWNLCLSGDVSFWFLRPVKFWHLRPWVRQRLPLCSFQS